MKLAEGHGVAHGKIKKKSKNLNFLAKTPPGSLMSVHKKISPFVQPFGLL